MKCLKNQYGLKKLMNQEVELQYCFEHAGRTCCNQNDILSIRSKMTGVRKLSSPKVNSECFALTSRVLCSHCDADVGVGNIPQETLCESFCQEWFSSCQDAFIDPYVDRHESVPFCKEDSMVCSSVKESF